MYDSNDSDSSAAPCSLTNPEPEPAQTTTEPPVETAACEIVPPEPPDSSAADESPPADESHAPASDAAFITAAEFARNTPPKTMWVAEPWVAEGSVTLCDGKAKAGKTSFTTRLVAAVATGKPFLGWPTLKTKVVYATEEGGQSLRMALKRAGLENSEDVILLPHHKVKKVSWPDVVDRIAKTCAEKGARMVVIDTLAKFAPGAEGSSSKALEAMGELERLKARGVAVLVTRHQRKAGGALGDSGRGSSALTGDADIVMALAKPEGHGGRKRIICAAGRFDGIPEKLGIELEAHGYVQLESADVEESETERAILSALPLDPGKAVDINYVIAMVPLRETAVRKRLNALVAQKKVLTKGKGARGSPLLYYLPAA